MSSERQIEGQQMKRFVWFVCPGSFLKRQQKYQSKSIGVEIWTYVELRLYWWGLRNMDKFVCFNELAVFNIGEGKEGMLLI